MEAITMGCPAAPVAHSVNLWGRLANVNPRPFIVLVVVNAGRHIMQLGFGGILMYPRRLGDSLIFTFERKKTKYVPFPLLLS